MSKIFEEETNSNIEIDNLKLEVEKKKKELKKSDNLNKAFVVALAILSAALINEKTKNKVESAEPTSVIEPTANVQIVTPTPNVIEAEEKVTDASDIIRYYKSEYESKISKLQKQDIQFASKDSTTAFYIKNVYVLITNKTDGTKEARLCVKTIYPESEHLYYYSVPCEYVYTSNGLEIQDYSDLIVGKHYTNEETILDSSIKDYKVYSIVNKDELREAVSEMTGLGVLGVNVDEIKVRFSDITFEQSLIEQLSKVLCDYDFGNRCLVSLDELEQILIPSTLAVYNIEENEVTIPGADITSNKTVVKKKTM